MGLVFTIKWAEPAASDLEEIFDFYFHKSPTAARKVIGEIVGRVESIDFTNQYQVDYVNANYRRVVVGHFKVLYRVNKEVVYISRIFNTRQDPKKQQS